MVRDSVHPTRFGALARPQILRSDPHQRAERRIAPRQREAIVLVYYQEMSNIEAAAAMQVSVDALESLLARGRRALQALLVGDDGDD